MPKKVYLGAFSNWVDLSHQFRIPASMPEPKYVWAHYDRDDYEGTALVVCSHDAVTFNVVEACHCSCYGLEDQFDPTPHSIEELKKMWYDNPHMNGSFKQTAFLWAAQMTNKRIDKKINKLLKIKKRVY